VLAQEQSLSSVLVGWWFSAGAGDSALGTSRFAAPARANTVLTSTASLLSLVFVEATTLSLSTPNYIDIALHSSVLPVCVLACLLVSALLPLPCPALHSTDQPILPACLRPACISIPHQHPPVPTITPASLPERA
jgi:hypothetical protein